MGQTQTELNLRRTRRRGGEAELRRETETHRDRGHGRRRGDAAAGDLGSPSTDTGDQVAGRARQKGTGREKRRGRRRAASGGSGERRQGGREPAPERGAAGGAARGSRLGAGLCPRFPRPFRCVPGLGTWGLGAQTDNTTCPEWQGGNRSHGRGFPTGTEHPLGARLCAGR